ncbi:MAG: hypothetical protein J6S50_00395 [Oscillospiraceae bacterium]|nr:hypothetical protein [Oscillospiraceae bacterium]MBO7726960.1 hypothetical protein [Oscillospiraceae bacterium]
MAAIDTQNAKQIRAPMLISCGIAAKSNLNLTISNISGFMLQDTSNPQASIKTEEWPIKQITDLQGDGFPLDGSCAFYVPEPGSEDGKIGLRTHIGGSGSLTVSASSEIPSLTIYTEGEGTITAGSSSYEACGVNIIPVNATSVSLTFSAANATERIIVYTIIPGVSISWDQDTIVSVELDLRSDLALTNTRWAVSEIEIRGYYPYDISEAVTGISDDVPIWYTAGYRGNMSPERRFYLSEPVKMENNIVTIRGHDSSYKLTKKGKAAQILNTTTGSGKRDLYSKMVRFITDAGITLRSRQTAPAKTTGSTEYTLIWKSNTYDAIIQNIMNLAHVGTFWPTFVDAGIPKVSHEKPTKKWDIYEEDCGNVERTVDRNLSKIRTEDDFGLQNTITREKEWQEIVRRHCKRDATYSQNAGGGYFWAFSVSNAKDIKPTAESVWWTAVKDTIGVPKMDHVINDQGEIVTEYTTMYVDECIVKAKPTSTRKDVDMVSATPARSGITVEMSPIAYGRVYGYNEQLGTSVFIYPNYKNLFTRSNITGKFKWKGDPRMMPRDVFRFHRLDGSYEDCTIETIVLKHEGGGTSAEISYRLGVC